MHQCIRPPYNLSQYNLHHQRSSSTKMNPIKSIDPATQSIDRSNNLQDQRRYNNRLTHKVDSYLESGHRYTNTHRYRYTHYCSPLCCCVPLCFTCVSLANTSCCRPLPGVYIHGSGFDLSFFYS